MSELAFHQSFSNMNSSKFLELSSSLDKERLSLLNNVLNISCDDTADRRRLYDRNISESEKIAKANINHITASIRKLETKRDRSGLRSEDKDYFRGKIIGRVKVLKLYKTHLQKLMHIKLSYKNMQMTYPIDKVVKNELSTN